MANNNKAIAEAIIEKVGGKENIVRCFHCVTRLRFVLKDENKVDRKGIEAINGVIALKVVEDQYQVVIGQNVGKVYEEVCAITGLNAEAAMEENLDKKEKKKLTPKSIGNNIIQAIVNSVIPALPVLIGAGMIKVIVGLLPMMGLMDVTSSSYLVLYNIGECGFYFLPIYVAINAAKHFKTSVPIATMTVAFLLMPAFTSGMADGTINSIGGMPITSARYSSTVLPAVMIVWVLSYVHRFFEKYIPKALSTILVPTLTLLIMVPLEIVAIGPLGVILGNYMGTFLMWLYNTFGWFGMGIMGALRPLLILTGMHTSLLPFAITTFSEYGYETFLAVTGMGYVFGSAAACLAVGLKSKKVENKSAAFSCATTALIGGVTEPSLYGVLMRYKKVLIAVMVGNFVGSAYFGLTHTYVYVLGGSSGIFGIPSLIGPTSANLINGLIGLGLSMIIAFVLTFVLGFEEK